jgi:hypothetical protein
VLSKRVRNRPLSSNAAFGEQHWTMLAGFLHGSSQGKMLCEGPLYRQGGLFKEWQKRYCELTEDALVCHLAKGEQILLVLMVCIRSMKNVHNAGGARMSQFSLTTTTQYMDSSLRPFCFILTDVSSGDCVTYACDSSADKDNWKENIVTRLTFISKSQNRLARMNFNKEESEQIRNDYLQRAIIYVKIIRATNLTAKDLSGTSDPFVEVTIGQSKEKTVTRKKTLNPEWGMVFKFDWDEKDRFAKIDVW